MSGNILVFTRPTPDSPQGIKIMSRCIENTNCNTIWKSLYYYRRSYNLIINPYKITYFRTNNILKSQYSIIFKKVRSNKRLCSIGIQRNYQSFFIHNRFTTTRQPCKQKNKKQTLQYYFHYLKIYALLVKVRKKNHIFKNY